MPSQKTEILFIERCIEFLKSGTGQMAIVLPDGILSNSTLQYVRDFLMERAQILAVISLPQFTFTHFGAGVKSSLVFVRKKGEKEKLGRYKIFMAIAEHIGYNATGKKDKQNDLITIQKEYEKFKKKNNNITPIVFQIWNDELKNRADSIFISRYLRNSIKPYKPVSIVFQNFLKLLTAI